LPGFDEGERVGGVFRVCSLIDEGLSTCDNLGGPCNCLTNRDGVCGWDNGDVDFEREAKGFSGRQPEEFDDNLRPVPQAIRQLLRIPQFQVDRMELLTQRGQSFDRTSASNQQ
jgi:hypothetical protein